MLLLAVLFPPANVLVFKHINNTGADKLQGGVAHIYTVSRSATAVKLKTIKVNGQFEIFSKVNGQATTFL